MESVKLSLTMILPVLLIFLGTTLADTTSRGAIARQKCSEYKAFVFTKVRGPILGDDFIPVSQCAISSVPLINGGQATVSKEYPHMAAVGFDTADGSRLWKCGGSIISEKYVLTAAHCANHITWREAKRVFVGDLNLVNKTRGAMPKTIDVAARIIHPEYRHPAFYHDIALLRLETDIVFNGWTRPACLHTEPTTGTFRAVATGWGAVAWGAEIGPNLLRKVTLPLVDTQTCNSRWQTNDDSIVKFPNGVNGNWSMCAGESERDTCQGDTGGPLVVYSPKVDYYCMYDIVGISSVGKGCGLGFPRVYTRVYHYVPWIESVVWGQE